MTKKRVFGSIRQLQSGLFQARYRGADGLMRAAPTRFPTKADANLWLSARQTELARGEWVDETKAKEHLREYAERWIRERANLAPRTRLGYANLLRLHVDPQLGDKQLGRLTAQHVRAWRSQLLDDGLGPSTVAKAYRLLKSILSTAVDDGIIARNPCRIRGAGQEHPDERPVLPLDLVVALADAIDPRYRALVLLAVFASMRWGELMALRVSDLNLDRGVVRVARSISELPQGVRVLKAPKTPAGLREIALPTFMRDELTAHLATFAEPGPDGRVFVGPYGATPSNSNFRSIWVRAQKKVGISGIHFHDLRHTGNHFASLAGASTKELMGRMGHSSMRAALIYQHRTTDRDQAIAEQIDKMVKSASKRRNGRVPRTTSEQLDSDHTGQSR